MQSAVPEMLAGLCPGYAEVEIFNEKEIDIPLDRHWDLVFFSYLHAYYEHTKVLSAIFRKAGMKTIAGGRHASHYSEDCLKYFDAVVIGDPEPNVPELLRDFSAGRMKRIYHNPPFKTLNIRPYRYDLIDYSANKKRIPGIEASRGCPFLCNFCVLSGREKYRCRPIKYVIEEIEFKIHWNSSFCGLGKNKFIFLDNNLGGSPHYLKELCEALIPLKKIWGCSLSFNILRNEELIKLMAKAGCRYIYTGLESLNPESINSMNKPQNNIAEVDLVIRRAFSYGIIISFGLLVGSDGDTNDYLEKLPEYLADLKHFSVTFVGFVCPYPETPFFRKLKSENRILPGLISRDLDGYTLCHCPKNLEPTEAIEHFQRLCKDLGSFSNVVNHYLVRFWNSHAPFYKAILLFSGAEILSIKNPIKNGMRKYIAGHDPIEEWDARKMREFEITAQLIN
jgi:radical SAM superfamily enzyme YgiQ (UPF0313 family)